MAESPVRTLLKLVRNSPDTLAFHEVVDLIDQAYDYTPTTFSNGLGDELTINPAGSNEGSCKLFAFARLNDLNEAETLACFAEHYRSVQSHPAGSDHANIRAFMRHGWPGIQFDRQPLMVKKRLS